MPDQTDPDIERMYQSAKLNTAIRLSGAVKLLLRATGGVDPTDASWKAINERLEQNPDSASPEQ
jgi:hypothetical protein